KNAKTSRNHSRNRRFIHKIRKEREGKRMTTPDLKKKFQLGAEVTPEQKAFYEKYGFVVFENVFDAETMAKINAELEIQKVKVVESGRTAINGVPIKFGIDEKGDVIPQRTPFMNLLSPMMDELV